MVRKIQIEFIVKMGFRTSFFLFRIVTNSSIVKSKCTELSMGYAVDPDDALLIDEAGLDGHIDSIFPDQVGYGAYAQIPDKNLFIHPGIIVELWRNLNF